MNLENFSAMISICWHLSMLVQEMVESLNGGDGGPFGAGNLMHDPEHTEFFRSETGTWNTPYGKFFLEWYWGMLLLHGERICREAETIFRGTEVNISAKVAAIHWHYIT